MLNALSAILGAIAYASTCVAVVAGTFALSACIIVAYKYLIGKIF